MSNCIFCKIVNGDIPAHVVHEDEHTLAIMDIGQVNPGHTLVLSKVHAATMMDADEELAAQLFRTANKIAKAVERALPAQGITILQANRPAGLQTVPHLHLHVLPRNEGDGVELAWPAKNPEQDVLAGYAEKIRAALAGS